MSRLRPVKLTTERAGSKSNIDSISYGVTYAIGFEDMAKGIPDITKLTSFTGWLPKLDIKTIIYDVSKNCG